MNTERGLHRETGSRQEALRPAQKAFVVRVPVVSGPLLRLSTVGGRLQETAIEFDLRSLASDERLPLAGFSPLARRVASPPNSGNRVDILVMGDGYTAAEEAKFNTDSANLLANLLNLTPYKEYQSFVNAKTLFTASAQSGADHPPYSSSCPATSLPTCCADMEMQSDPLQGTFVNTAFDATFCSYNVHRILVVDTAKVFTAAAAYPDWDKILVVVNDSTYGGSGGELGVVSTHASAVAIAQHEYGHFFTGLADEYSEPYPDYTQCSDLTGSSPCEANVTNETTRGLIKWNQWILPSTRIPTVGTDSSIVGLFQGARYLTTGMYRPQDTCTMNALGAPFCRICAQAYVLRLYTGGWGNPANGIDNIESGSENPPPGTLTLSVPASLPLCVRLLQPSGNTVSATWTVNGATAASGSNFTFKTSTSGTYIVQLKTHDATPFVNAPAPGAVIDHFRTWTIQATGLRSGSLTDSLPAGRQKILADGINYP